MSAKFVVVDDERMVAFVTNVNWAFASFSWSFNEFQNVGTPCKVKRAWHLSPFMCRWKQNMQKNIVYFYQSLTPFQRKKFHEMAKFIWDSVTRYVCVCCVHIKGGDKCQFIAKFGMSDNRINLNEKCLRWQFRVDSM